MKVHVMRGMVAIALAVGAMLGSAGIASAAPVDPGCNSNGTSTWAGFDWVPNSSNHLYGVRAPVKLRSDGLLCTDSVHDSTSSVWIMI